MSLSLCDILCDDDSDGVKMGSWVYLNGIFLGETADQFLRYKFPVTSHLSASGQPNKLELVFPPSNHTLNAEARWMACSGAWDWAPYTSTYNDKGAHTMSKGVWKSVYLLGIGKGEAALEHLQPRIYYNGSFPVAPLDDSSAGGWTVEVRVHLVSAGAASGTVEVSGQWGDSASTPASLVAGDNIVTVSLTVPAGKVKMWWPNGMGVDHLPNLYNLSATWTPAKVRSLYDAFVVNP